MTVKERKNKEAKERLAKAMSEFVWDSRIEWPQQMEDISDLVDLENEISDAIEDYEYSDYEVVALVEIMFYEYKHAFDRHQIREVMNDVIKYDVPRILARYLAKEQYGDLDF